MSAKALALSQKATGEMKASIDEEYSRSHATRQKDRPLRD